MMGKLPIPIRKPLRLMAAALILLPGAVQAEERKNWYDDPFEQATDTIPQCGQVKGPLRTKEEALADAHHRIERGNSCVLDGRCEPGGPYQHDHEINKGVVQAIKAAPQLQRSSIWVSTEHKWVTLEGCIAEESQRGNAVETVRRVPMVEFVIDKLQTSAR
ncbi:BON domain-containing protein [Noviherbaspirillum sp.]|uniref:BON domain-containing protein n=1 Tax=Noviherbaspirillum sp. TaxID=1926288 RepID=UPI002B495536|nr:BON domain-containing protein [Noviherbaspirillum sp.]HJV79798.1 BON domain-containing protein [Noviherbaspirillum sp.]